MIEKFVQIEYYTNLKTCNMKYIKQVEKVYIQVLRDIQL